MDLEFTPSLEAMKLETMANPFAMLNPVVKNHLKAFTKDTAGVLRQTGLKLLSLTKLHKYDLTLQTKVTIQKLNKSDYMDNASYMVPVPLGLNIMYRDYITQLQEAWIVSRDFAEQSIAKVDQYISTVLAYPDRLGVVEENAMVQAITFNTAKIDAYKLGFEKSFDNKHTVEMKPFGEVYSRNKDFEEVSNMVVTLSKDYSNRDNKKLNSLVNQLAEKSSLLHTRVSQGKLNITTQTAEHIATVLSQTAQEVEFYASVSQMIEELLGKYGDVVRTLDQKLA